MNEGSPGGRPLSESAQRVQDALRLAGFANEVLELDFPVKTAHAAADAVGCSAGQIVKSLVFQGAASGRAILVVASGGHRVSLAKLEAVVGEPVAMGSAKFVRASTGYSIGGIPPLGHAQPMVVVMDEHLLALGSLWAAAGHPNSLFPLSPDELARMTGATVADLAE